MTCLGRYNSNPLQRHNSQPIGNPLLDEDLPPPHTVEVVLTILHRNGQCTLVNGGANTDAIYHRPPMFTQVRNKTQIRWVNNGRALTNAATILKCGCCVKKYKLLKKNRTKS